VAGGNVGAAIPNRSREQRLRALEQANQVRSARASLKQELASGKLELAQIVADPPACAETARVRDLLLALPTIGAVKAGRILARCGIAHSKTLAGLTDRQRGELINLFPATHPERSIPTETAGP
jgi:predicted flap endonuclease-1-like 5' DNA nuclease